MHALRVGEHRLEEAGTFPRAAAGSPRLAGVARAGEAESRRRWAWFLGSDPGLTGRFQ